MKLIENLCHCTGLKLTDEQIKKLEAIGRLMDCNSENFEEVMSQDVRFDIRKGKNKYYATITDTWKPQKEQLRTELHKELDALEEELRELHKQNLTLENIQRMNEIEIKCAIIEEKIVGI